MHIESLHLKNFRKFKTLDLVFNKGLNVLIGENDSGKTAIIDAIKLVLGTHSNDWIRLEKEDFYSSDGTNYEYEMKIICTFNDLSEDEAAMFLEWLSIDNGNYYLKLSLKAKRKDKGNSLSEVFYDVRAGEDEENGVMSGLARNKLRATYLKPLRDAQYELAPRKGSRLSQILNNYDIFQKEKPTDEHRLEKIMREANEDIEKYFSAEEGKVISKKINDDFLGEDGFSLLHNPLSSKFGITKQELGRILERLELQGFSTDSGGNLGLGSNNLLFIAAEMLLLKGDNYIGLKLSLIEEIEAHLHPQAQINLVDFLSKKSDILGLQTILSTHSNVLASKVDLNNLIICKNGKAFSLRKEETKLNQGDYGFLKRFLDDTKANLFFANGVIIVEGDAENLLLPTFAKFIGYPLHKYGISIVNVGSTALLRFAKIFLRKETDKGELDIPVAVITDLDVKPKEFYEDDDNNITSPTYYQVSEGDIACIKAQFSQIQDIDFTDITSEKYGSKTEIEKAFKNIIPQKLGLKTKVGKVLCELVQPTNIDLNNDLPTIKNNVLSKKMFYEQKVKYFVGKDWTLEYLLGLSCIKNLFYEAILTAQLILKSDDFDESSLEIIEEIKEIKKVVEKNMREWEKTMNREEIAYKLYWEIMQGKDKNKTSKAVVAQCLSSLFKEQPETLKNEILQDEYLKYLVEAIKYAANVPS